MFSKPVQELLKKLEEPRELNGHSIVSFVKAVASVRSTLTSHESTALLHSLLDGFKWLRGNHRNKVATIIVDLLDRGADVQLRTPFLAITEDNLIRIFLEKGADPNQRDSNQEMSLMNCNMGPVGLKLLLDNGADPHAQDKDGNSPLFYHENPEKVQLLLEAGADVNHHNQSGHTALMYSSTQKSIEVLLQHGAEPNKADRQGKTALMHLKGRKSTNVSKVLKILVAAGADIYRTFDGKTLLQHYLAQEDWPYRDKYDCQYDCAIALLNLKESSQLVNIPDKLGHYPLNYLGLKYSALDFKLFWTENDPVALIQALLKNGADPNLPDKNGETPLMFWASQTTLKFSKSVVALMLDAGADTGLTDLQGRTALMYAAKHNNVEAAKVLLPKTDNPNVRCQQGYSCLEHALSHPQWQRKKMIPTLIDGGVHVGGNFGGSGRSVKLLLLGSFIAIGDCVYAVELLQQGAKINKSTLQTLGILPQELVEKIHFSQKITPKDENFIALARMQPELFLSALDCGDARLTEQLHQLVERVTSESQESELFQKLLSPWPPHFAQRQPIVINDLASNPPPPEINYRHDETNEYRKYETAFEAWFLFLKNNNNDCLRDDALKVEKTKSYQVVAEHHRQEINILFLANNDILTQLWNETVSAEIRVNRHGDTQFEWEKKQSWRYSGSTINEDALKYLLWRCGSAAVPGMLRVAQLAPALLCRVLWPVADSRIVPLMVSQIKHISIARHWLLRHSSAAAHGLIPVAVGNAGTLRDDYEKVLRLLDSYGHGQAIRDAAAAYGQQVSAAVSEILSVDRSSDFHLLQSSDIPLWVSRGQYHLPVEKATGLPLPSVYLHRLFQMMSLSTLDDIYPPLTEILPLFDRRSLAKFGWSVFLAWEGADTNQKTMQQWMLYCLGYLGDDTTISRLVAVVHHWSKTNSKRTVTALSVIASIGSDAAIFALNDYRNNRESIKAVKIRAKELLEEISWTRNCNPEELQDRLVPAFDLDKPATLQLNFSGRVFTIGINEKMVPSLYDNHGLTLKSLPKARKDDDPDLAKAATEHWRQLKAGLKKAASNHLPRLEQAMLNKRQWSSEDFNRYLSGHPLLQYVVRSLIWCAVWDEQPECYFRINDNGDFLDAADCPVTVPAAAQIFLPHPINMGQFFDLWKDSLVRNRIKQPFAQITRQVYRKEEDIHQDLFGIQGAKAPAKGFRGLKTTDWVPDIGDGGNIWGYRKSIGSGTAYIGFDGIVTMRDDGYDEDLALDVELSNSLTNIEFSEVVREIKGLLY